MNLFYNKDGMIVYHAAALGIVYDKTKHVQYFFHGHDDDITALAMNPKDKVTIAHSLRTVCPPPPLNMPL